MGFNFNFLKTAGKDIGGAAKSTFNFLNNNVNPITKASNDFKQNAQAIVTQARQNPQIQSNPDLAGQTKQLQTKLDNLTDPAQKLKSLAVDTARSVARVPGNIATSLSSVAHTSAGNAMNSTADQLQALDINARKDAISKNPGLQKILKDAGADPSNPTDAELGKLKSSAVDVSKPVTFTPGNRVEKAVLGDQPIQSYQQRTEGNKQVIEKSRFKGAATPLSILGAGLTIGGDVAGFGGPEKAAVEDTVTQLAKATTESGVKKLLEDKVAPEIVDKIAGAISQTKDSNIVSNILKNAGVTADNLLQTGAKNVAQTAGKDVIKKGSDNPVVSAIDDHLAALNQKREQLLRQGKTDASPEVKANSQAYKDALASKNGVISDVRPGAPAVDVAQAPSIIPTEAPSGVQQMHNTLDVLDRTDTSQMPADKLAEFNQKKDALRAELNKAEPPASTTAPSILPGAAVSDVKSAAAVPPGLAEATVPVADTAKQAPTVAETVAAKLRGSAATKGEPGVAGVSNLQRQQAAINVSERAQRIAAGQKAAEGLTGREALNARKAAYGGEFAKADSKALVESVQKAVTPQESDQIIEQLVRHPELTPHEQINAAEGWRAFYEDGKLPPPSTSALWDKALGSNFTDSALEHAASVPQGFRQKAGEVLGKLAATPKSIMASFDLSGGGRQGGVLGARFPKEFKNAVIEQAKYFASPDKYEAGMREIATRANAPIYDRMKLALTGVKEFAKPEEQFVGSYAEGKLAKNLGIGHVVAASDRAYTGVLTKLRADAADHIISDLEKAGIDINQMNDKQLKDIGRFINTASGRGELGSLEKHATSLQTALFSPRLWKSRLDMLNPAYYAKLDPVARKYALQSAASFAGIATAVLSLAAAAGAQVGTDPRSSDFGKIKVGNTRFDILGGFQQNIRVAAQLVSGEKVNTANGEVQKLSGGFGGSSRWNVLDQFLTNKANPVIGAGRKILEGTDPAGNPVNPFTTVGNLFVPLSIQDAYQGYKDSGATGVAKTIPGLLGAGVQNYQVNVTNKQKTYIDNLKKKGADSNTVKATTEFFQAAKRAPSADNVRPQIQAAIDAGDQAKVVSLVNDYNKKYADAFKVWTQKYGAQYGTKDLQDFYNRGKITPADLSRTVSKVKQDKADKAKGVVKL